MGRYAALAQALNGWGYAVRAYDQYGHGASEGPRGGLPTATRLLDDLALVVDHTRATVAAGQALLLLGHSMGGLVIRAWMRAKGDAQVAVAVTLGSPHLGTQITPHARLPNAPHPSVCNVAMLMCACMAAITADTPPDEPIRVAMRSLTDRLAIAAHPISCTSATSMCACMAALRRNTARGSFVSFGPIVGCIHSLHDPEKPSGLGVGVRQGMRMRFPDLGPYLVGKPWEGLRLWQDANG
jgi:pimeloyl-ACP methyl ester carboxylesterase